MDLTLFAYVSVGLGSGVLGSLLSPWLSHRFAIKRAKFDEERQLEYKRREASAAVADILAEWVRSGYTGKSSGEDRWRLQTTYWKNILWLDKELLDFLLPLLAYAEGAPGTNELIVQTRKILLGLSEPDISADQLNNWLPIKEGKVGE